MKSGLQYLRSVSSETEFLWTNLQTPSIWIRVCSSLASLVLIKGLEIPRPTANCCFEFVQDTPFVFHTPLSRQSPSERLSLTPLTPNKSHSWRHIQKKLKTKMCLVLYKVNPILKKVTPSLRGLKGIFLATCVLFLTDCLHLLTDFDVRSDDWSGLQRPCTPQSSSNGGRCRGSNAARRRRWSGHSQHVRDRIRPWLSVRRIRLWSWKLRLWIQVI